MENRIEPTFKAIDHKLNGAEYAGDVPINVTKIIERVTTVDMTGVEDNLVKLIEVISAKQIVPDIKINPSELRQEIIRQEIPAINVTVPEQKADIKNEVNVVLNPVWLFLMTFIIVADIIVRVMFVK